MLENITTEEIKDQFKKNNTLRMVTFGIGGLLVLIIGYFVYRQFVVQPKNEKSKDAYWVGLNYANQDSTDVAIDELSLAVKQYDGYVGGEVAQFVLGKQLMNKGEFQKAIDELEGVDTEDTYVSAMAQGLIGDCYSELANYKEAVTAYVKASELNSNDLTSPMYLFKAGLCAEELKDFENATEFYTTIQNEYPSYASRKTIEKYIARVSSNDKK